MPVLVGHTCGLARKAEIWLLAPASSTGPINDCPCPLGFWLCLPLACLDHQQMEGPSFHPAVRLRFTCSRVLKLSNLSRRHTSNLLIGDINQLNSSLRIDNSLWLVSAIAIATTQSRCRNVSCITIIQFWFGFSAHVLTVRYVISLLRLLRCLSHPRLYERAQGPQQRPQPLAQRRRLLPT